MLLTAAGTDTTFFGELSPLPPPSLPEADEGPTDSPALVSALVSVTERGLSIPREALSSLIIAATAAEVPSATTSSAPTPLPPASIVVVAAGILGTSSRMYTWLTAASSPTVTSSASAYSTISSRVRGASLRQRSSVSSPAQPSSCTRRLPTLVRTSIICAVRRALQSGRNKT